MLTVIEENILSTKEQYIAHPCNCITTYASGLDGVIFKKWSYADCYSIRWDNDKPGTIEVRGNGKENRYVINMFAQINPGKPNVADDPRDGYQARKQYFINCMKQISLLNPESVAMPWFIGYGLSSESWEFYEKVIDKFSNQFNITLYKLPEKKP